MKQRLMALFVALVLSLASLGLTDAPALADESAPEDGLPTIKIDVDADNGVYDGYTVDDDEIVLHKTDAIYELHGNSERRVLAASSAVLDGTRFCLRLNDVYVGGGGGFMAACSF